MTYVSLYRKWRPQTFAEVISQEHVTRTLQNALRMRRIAHAYLLAGPRGTGKTTVARLLAKALECEEGPTPEPCDRCANCVQIREGTSLDVVEIDGASNRGIEEIRDLREKVKLVPVQAPYKVYIIDEIHMLTADAFNALLKTLEEPPAHVVFIFATTEPHKIPATILSRCQRFDFKRLTVAELSERLGRIAAEEGLELTPGTVALIARNADGGLRDALSLLDQCVAFAGEKVTLADVEALLGTVESEVLLHFMDLVAAHDLVQGLAYVGELVDAGKDLHRLTRDLMGHLRNLLLLKLAPAMRLEAVEPELSERMLRQADRFTRQALVDGIEVLAEAEAEIRWASQDRLPLELALIRLVGLAGTETATAQAPAAAAVPPATIPAAPSDSAAQPASGIFTERWAGFLAELGDSGLTNMVSVFRKGDPPRLIGQTIYLEFAPGSGFFLKKASDHQEQMERAIRRFFGETFRFRPVTRGEVPAEPAESAAGGAQHELAAAAEAEPIAQPASTRLSPPEVQTGEEDVRKDPLVRKAIELFGATLVRVEP